MDPFGYQMAVDAARGNGLPNVGYYVDGRALEIRSPPDTIYELGFVRRRYARRGGVIGSGFNGASLQLVLDELQDLTTKEPVDTPLFVMPKTVKRRGRKQEKPKKYGNV